MKTLPETNFSMCVFLFIFEGWFYLYNWPKCSKPIFYKCFLFITCMCELLTCVQLFATSWTAAHQTPLSMGFLRQEYWSGLSFPSPGGLPNPKIEPGSPALQTDSLPSETLRKPYPCANRPTLRCSTWLPLPLGEKPCELSEDRWMNTSSA